MPIEHGILERRKAFESTNEASDKLPAMSMMDKMACIDMSIQFEDLDHSSRSIHDSDGLACSRSDHGRPKLDTTHRRQKSSSRHGKYQQSCFELGGTNDIIPAESGHAGMPMINSSMRRVKSSDHLDSASMHSTSGIRPPRRSKSFEKEMESMAIADAAASRRKRRPAPRSKSLGQHDAGSIVDVAIYGAKVEAPVNKLSALQRPSVKKETGPKKEMRRIGLAPPGTGDGIFKAKIKSKDSSQSGSTGKRAPRAKSGGLLGLMKGRPPA